MQACQQEVNPEISEQHQREAGQQYYRKFFPGHAPAPGRYGAKSRYRQADAACAFVPSEPGFRLDFDAPQWAVTPGQSAVLYDGDVCLGGGVIQRAARWAAAAPSKAGEPVEQ